MALDSACVTRIICGTLGVAARTALRSAWVALRTVYDANLALLRSKLIVLDLALLPVQVAEDAANFARQAAETPLTVVDPLAEAAAVCVDLGSLIESFSIRFDLIDADASDALDKVRRLLSVRDLVEAGIAELEAKLAVVDEALLVLDACA